MAKQTKPEPTIEELTAKLDTVIKKAQEAADLRSSIIKLQEDLIGELIEQLGIEKQRGRVSFKAGSFFGLVVGTIICMIINLIIIALR